MAQFRTWLKNQQERSDAIGRLAVAATQDKEFPRANKLNVIVDYLTSKGANDKLLDTVENAFAEFENNPQRKSRAVKDTVTERKKPGPKPGSKKTTNKKEAANTDKGESARNEDAAVATMQQAGTEQKVPGRRGRPRKVVTDTEEQQPKARRGRKPKSEMAPAQLPERLMPLFRQLADASAVLDAQFGTGYSNKNSGQVLEFAKMLLTADQNRMLHFTFADLAEALHRVASRLESSMRNPY